ncbi:hypothetical protein CEXT_38761 [Caerostris extrusa]|uniref:THAP-type domain-containing protein n=1 Tax=Caerostris extrusa TaxID=172846 RepID=A0AAV4UI93_CAEEX|nr:hypothetical protein CEXT_38761 [Caerostris extrusa]
MSFYCNVSGCFDKFMKVGLYTFHKYPHDENRRKTWLLAVKWENFKVTTSNLICSKCFSEQYFDKEKFGSTWLKISNSSSRFGDIEVFIEIP